MSRMDTTERLTQPEEMVPGAQCSRGRPGEHCDVEAWSYATTSIHPRIYGRCQRCSTVYAVFLPRRRGWEMSEDDRFIETLAVDALVINAAEKALLQSGTAQRLWWLLTDRPIAIERKIIDEIRNDARTLAVRHEHQLQKLADLLLERLREVEKLKDRLSRKHARRAVIKMREALAALRGHVRQERPELDRLRSEAREIRRAIAAEREAAHREPLPTRLDHMPIPLDKAAVLCDTITPSEVIYALVDPADAQLVRYVGRTCDPVSRYRGHCTSGTDVVSAWVASVLAAGRRPAMVLLERCERDVVEGRERHWIRWYRERYQADFNRSVPR